MTRSQPLYQPGQKIGSLLLMLALLWLSVSTPFVYRFQQQTRIEKQALEKSEQQEDNGPLTNTNEEKAESSAVNTLQEYLHEPLHLQHPTLEQVNEYGHFEQKASIAWHPEYVSPPPDDQPAIVNRQS